MEITCWGARGSIPVSGREYVRYGGDTACLQVTTGDGRTVVIDAGTGARRLGRRLVDQGVTTLSLLFTHAHWDHLLGLPFFAPLYREGTRIELFGAPMAQTSVRDMVSHTMKPPYFPVRVEDLAADMAYQGSCTDLFRIGTLAVEPFPLSHPNGGLGYKLVEDGKTFVFLTDNELGHVHEGGLSVERYAAVCAGADLLVHDAEYTPEEAEKKRTWGHSSYLQAVELALAAGVQALGLFHHNHERSDAEVDAIVDRCRSIVADRRGSLHVFAVAPELKLPL
jgi:phosphoribosyl 1,2-cyclic phosphodiesterase